MQKVLLVGPSTYEQITETRWVTAPLGIHYVASYLNRYEHYAEVYDMNIDTISFEDKLKEKNWDIVGISTLEASLEYDISKMHLAKKILPNCLLVAGGTGAALNYQEYFNKSPLDIVVQAEGEMPMLELCNMIDSYGYWFAPLHMIEGLIIRNRARVLTQPEYWNIRKCLDVKAMRAQEYWDKTAKLYDNPDFNEINTFRLYTSNFCPMNCGFCTLTRLRKYACGKHTPVIQLTPDQIVDLVIKVVDEYKDVRQIFFVDDDFFINKQRGIDFCNQVIDLKRRKQIPDYLKFICLTNINRIDETNIDVVAQAGFRVLSIGVESTSQHVLDSIDKKQTVKTIWKTTNLILDKGIKPYYTLILFSPDCTIDDLIIDLHGFRDLGKIGVGLSVEPVFIPLKGTRFSEEHYPERVRAVKVEGTNEVVWKGFAWIPRNKDVIPVFELFEKIYPKYRKYVFDRTTVKHKEKNFQAYLILDVLEFVLMELKHISTNYRNPVFMCKEELDKLEDCNVDIVGAIT